MTLVLGLRCRDGVVLASDSQRTEGTFREEIPKLFVTPAGIVWGVAGSIAVQQELRATLDALDLPAQPSRAVARDAIARAVRTAVRQATAAIDAPSLVARTVQGIFAWHSESEHETFVLRVLETGHAEPAPKYSAVGASSACDLARFALSQSEHLGYATPRLEAAKMLAFNVVDDVIRASARSVCHPVQLAVVTAAQHELLAPAEVQGVADTLAAFREHQRDFLGREETVARERDTGIRPS
jgi:predicted proteasome-type protease